MLKSILHYFAVMAKVHFSIIISTVYHAVHFGKCQGGSTIENGCFDIGKGTDGKGKEK